MNKELLFSVTKKDFRIDTFRSGGNGGQNQNKLESGVRITHLASGAVGESREERKQGQNKKIAFRRLLQDSRWKVWFEAKKKEALGHTEIEQEPMITIRSYNMIKDRITDHRTDKKIYDQMKNVLDGDLDKIR